MAPETGKTCSDANVGPELDFAGIMNTVGQGLLVTGENGSLNMLILPLRS
jgi:hypothetical protein